MNGKNQSVMLKMKGVLFLGLSMSVLIGLVACRTTDNVPQEDVIREGNETNATMRKLAFGALTGNGEEGIEEGGVVIQTEAEWRELVTKMNSVNKSIDENSSIDFNKKTVLAYFDPVRGSGGYSVYITEITSNGSSMKATIEKVSPTEDAIEIMTQSYFIVSIDKTSLPITFVD
jgi:predicted membrane GTPase involved in stress response